MMPRKLPSLLTLAVLAGIASLSGCADDDARKGPPNVVFWLVDTLRADRLSCYGYARPTPAFDALARGGVRFEQVHAHTNWTQPSVATLLTGCFAPPFSRAFGDRLPESMTTAPEWFKAHGYATVGRTLTVATSAQFGFAQGYDEYLELDRDLTWLQRKRRADDVYLAERLVDSAIAWIDGPRAPEQPFFLMLHTIDPHEPYTRHPDVVAYAAAATTDMDGSVERLQARKTGGNVFSPPEQKLLSDLYDEEVAYNDAQLARFVEHLRQRDLLDDTLIVVVADHGEELFDRMSIGHGGRNLHRELTHIPWILHWPNGLPAGRVVKPLVGAVDTLPTLLELIGLEPLPGIDGESRAWLVRDEPAPRPYRPIVVVEVGKVYRDPIGARTPDLLYVNDRTRRFGEKGSATGLWQLAIDPHERANAYANSSDVVASIDSFLAKWEKQRVERAKAFISPNPVPLDDDSIRRLQELGYLGDEGEDAEPEANPDKSARDER